MNTTKSFKEIEAWKKAHEFVLLVYKHSENFPKAELFGLTSQFRRASVSIAANIAEGYRKNSNADKIRFYNISQGSLEECRYYCLLAKDLNYINYETVNTFDELLELTSKLLNTYIRAIKTNIS